MEIFKTHRRNQLLTYSVSFLVMLLVSLCWPRFVLLESVSAQVSQSIPDEIRKANTVLRAESALDRMLQYLLPRYEAQLQGIMSQHKEYFLSDCQASFATSAASDPLLSSRELKIPGIETANNRTYIHISCETQWPSVLLASASLAGLFTFILSLLPTPFSSTRLQWVARLKQEGLVHSEALRASEALDQHNEFSDAQHALLEKLHDKGSHDFRDIVTLVSATPTEGLSNNELAWLDRAMECYTPEQALAIALSPAQLILDLSRFTATLHGWEIELPKTPFFYFVWYAQRRKSGEGWYKNPKSNKPDTEEARHLASLMWHNNGHAKAIGELESHGIRSRTLDQNRSKLKDEITLVLGEELASPYLFEAKKEPGVEQTSYRLALAADNISVLGQATSQSPDNR